MRHLLSAILWIPALGALMLAVMPSTGARLARGIAMATSSLVLALALVLWIQFEPRGVQWQFFDQVTFGPSPALTYVVGVDGVGALIVVLTAVVIWSAILLSADASDETSRRASDGARSHVSDGTSSRASDGTSSRASATLAIEAGVIGALVSLNLVFVGVFWILAVAAAWRLVAVSRAAGAHAIARRFARQAGLAVVTLIAAIAVLLVATGARTFDLRALQQLGVPELAQAAAFVLFLVAFATTSGAFPFHLVHRAVVGEMPASVWLPIAVALSNLGTFGLLRLGLPIAPAVAPAIALAVALVSLAGAVSAIVIGARQSTFAQLTAYASLAQVSAIFLSSTALTPLGLTATVIQHVSRSVVMLMLAFARPLDSAQGEPLDFTRPIAIAQVEPFDVARDRPFDAHGGPFDLAHGRPFDAAHGRPLDVDQGTPLAAAPSADARALTSPYARWIVAAAMMLLVGVAIAPAPILPRIETSVARLVLRVSPQHAAEVSDCLTASQAPPPPPSIPGLPASASMAAPCETSGSEKK
jgi:NADH:ubiquinone oxidoreductase subunit 4 (subunit M)